MKKQMRAGKGLSLHRETLRHLESRQLRDLAGGTASAQFTDCYTDCGTCPIDSCIRCQDSFSCSGC